MGTKHKIKLYWDIKKKIKGSKWRTITSLTKKTGCYKNDIYFQIYW